MHKPKSLLVSLTGLLFALVLTCCLGLESEESLLNEEKENDLLRDDRSFFAAPSSALLSSSSSTPSLRRGRRRQRQEVRRRLEEEVSDELFDDWVKSNNTEIYVAPYEFPEIDCKDFSNFNAFCPATSTDADADADADGCCHGDNMFTKRSCNRIYQGNAALAGQYCFWCCDGIILGTKSPSSIPTSFPSQVPSGSPSISMAPSTGEPSLLPSDEPSLYPSGAPSISELPSVSVLPSQTPSTSIKPSNMPSIQPSTSFPSFQPSTNFPSNIPTSSISPSDAPSNLPTVTPPFPKIDYCSILGNLNTICGTPRLQGCCEEKDNLQHCNPIYYTLHPNDIGSICYWCCNGKVLDPSVMQLSQSPSKSPTTQPSTSPTKNPSTPPTFKPTYRPTKAPITLAPVTSSPVTSSPITLPPTKQAPFTGSYICSAGFKKDQFCQTADDCGSGNSCIPEPPLNSKYMVGSYYYPWHGPDFHGGQYLREYLTPKQVPELGEYDDTKADIIGRHLAWTRVVAKSNLWVTSWAGQSERRDNTIKNHILKHPNLPGTKISLFYETLSRIRQKTIVVPQLDVNGTIMKDENGTIITKEDIYIDSSKPGPDMEYMAKTYFDDPNYLRINDRPVVFVYLTRSLAAYSILEQVVTDFREAARDAGYPSIYIVGDQTWNKAPTSSYEPFKLLDAVTNYDVYGNMGRQPGYSGQARVDAYYRDQKGWYEAAKKQKCSFIPGTSPGYNDRGTRLASDHPGTSRKLTASSEFGSLFQAMMEGAIEIVDPDAGNMIMITSFNEWHEDTQIEPVKVTQAPTGNATNPDLISPDFLTYEGYGEKYLEIIRNVTTPS